VAETIGFIGLGVMGKPMAGHLLKGGYHLVVHNRSRGPVDELVAAGATAAASPAEVARAATVVITMLPDTPDVERVLTGPDGVLSAIQKGAIVIDMSSISPVATERLAKAVAEKGASMLDAPVSGGEIGAINAALSIMVGGDAAVFERVRPLFELMGKTIVHQGGPGSGQHTKMVNQILIATGMIGVCEALLYGYRAGLDLPTVLESVSGGAAGSWSLSNYGPRMLAGDFEPGFFVEHFVKDMGIALSEARRMQLSVPGLALAEQLYVALVAQGGARKGTQALLLALASLSDVDWAAQTG
jgi:3-hydroxyisobutyrate dehydrogenase